MNYAKAAFENKVTTLVLTFCALGGGMIAYQGLSRLEDPAFTIKDALVVTPYPGASAAEVEEEVSDVLETAVQQMAQLDEVESKSDRGLSTLTVSIQRNYTGADLPQIWDELRRKVNDAQGDLPPGAGPSIVVDDFGDVYGVFLAVYGEGYSYAELWEFVKLLQRELLLVQDVAKIGVYANRTEAVYVELDRDRMSQLGVPTSAIVNELRVKNAVTNSGRVKVGTEFIAIEPSGTFTSVEEFESLLIRGVAGGQQIRLRDVATVRRGYVEPANPVLRFDGNPAVGLGISTVAGGNVVTMGEALRVRVQELADQTPLGIEFGIIALQSEAVSTAISGFVSSLIQAVVIVIVVLLFFMGLRAGLLIGFILVLTIAATFMVMSPIGIALERISLGALIIALGMLVDNAIVVVDGMLVKIQQGGDPRKAGEDVVNQTAIPLLGATFVAVLGFAAIGTSDDSTGEFCRSLFQVVFISLNLSWVTAVTVTPLLAAIFLKAPAKQKAEADPYGGKFYGTYRKFLVACIKRRGPTMGVVVGMFLVALWGFRFVDKSFFPSSTRPQFMIDYWMPQGTHIDDTEARVAEIEEYVMAMEGVTHMSSFVGQGGLRFLLTYTPEKLNSAYAQFVVEVDDYRKIDGLAQEVERYLETSHAHALGYTQKFQLGPGGAGLIQARLSGPDPDLLRSLAGQVQTIMHDDGNLKGIRTDWRQRVKLVRPQIVDEVANLNGITRPDIAAVLQTGFQGAAVAIRRQQRPEPPGLESHSRADDSAAAGGDRVRDGVRGRAHLALGPHPHDHRLCGSPDGTGQRVPRPDHAAG
jgi:multidrug efflux pump subunit AcrB